MCVILIILKIVFHFKCPHRSVSGVRGLTRECLIALVADIETRNYRQEFNESNGIPPEHPRSSITDDIECFFSVLRDVVGKDFTLKQVRPCTLLLLCMCNLIHQTGLVWLEESVH